MKRTVAVVATALAAALGVSACGGSGSGNPLSQSSGGAPAPSDTVKIGSANFTEDQLLAEIYAAALGDKGVKVDKQLNIGSRETYFPSLTDGSIDLIPDYTGNLLQYLDKNATATSPADVYAALTKALPTGLTVLDQSAAEDKDAVVVSKDTATKYHATSIADLAAHCGDLVFGGPPEFKERTYGIPGIAKAYNCTFKDFTALDAGGPLTVKALKDGSIQAADLFTTDTSIAANNFVALADPKNNFAAQNVVPLINSKKAGDTVKQVLNAVSAKLDTVTLTALNTKLGGPDKPDVATVAKDWVTSVGL